MEKTRKLVIIGVCAVFIMISISLAYALQPVNKTVVGLKDKFVIEKGEGVKEIADNLYNDGFIKAKKAFKMYSLLSGQAHLFKPGIYILSPSWNSVQIAKLFIAGPADVNVYIPEGATVRDIDKKLSQLGVIKEGELENFSWQIISADFPFLKGVKSLEGFLFPDTYIFAQFSPIEIVVREMLGNFNKKAWPYLKNLEDPYYNMVIASLVEKEVPFSNDRKIVAGVIYNRLKKEMPLQIDATIAYVKCEGKFLTCDSSTRRLLKSDMAIDSPFNTYLNKEVPPAPIANFSVDAIKAALNPAKTSYLYYISDPWSRQTIFAQTLDEHNLNRVKYLR